ncbi:MAG: leucine-rich repeat protein [Mycoplasma sp.]
MKRRFNGRIARNIIDYCFYNKVKVLAMGGIALLATSAVAITVPVVLMTQKSEDTLTPSFGNIVDVKEDYVVQPMTKVTEKLYNSSTLEMNREELDKIIDTSIFPEDAKLLYTSGNLISSTKGKISFIADKYNMGPSRNIQEPAEFYFVIDVEPTLETIITGNANANHRLNYTKDSLEVALTGVNSQTGEINTPTANDILSVHNIPAGATLTLNNIDDETHKNYFKLEVQTNKYINEEGITIPRIKKFEDIRVYHLDFYKTEFTSNGEYSVKGFAPGYGRETIKDYIFPAKINNVIISEIADRAFENTTVLGKISFSQNTELKRIGSRAFANCTTYQTVVTIPSTVQSIGAYAFENMNNVQTIDVKDTSYGDEWWKGFSADGWEKINYRSGEVDGGGENNTIFKITGNAEVGLTITGFKDSMPSEIYDNVVIPDSIAGIPVVAIADGAFHYKDDPTKMPHIKGEVYIGNNVKTIGAYAFRSQDLSSVKLGNSLEIIEENAFTDNNEMVGGLIIPSTVRIIGDDAFSFSTFTALDLSSATQLTEIGNSAFQRTGMTGRITIPGNLKVIGQSAFSSNDYLTGIDFSRSTLEEIQYGAFSSCKNLGKGYENDTIRLPETVTNLWSNIFANSGYVENDVNILKIRASEEQLKSKETWGNKFTGTILGY